jgi:hypothetical protein
LRIVVSASLAQLCGMRSFAPRVGETLLSEKSTGIDSSGRRPTGGRPLGGSGVIAIASDMAAGRVRVIHPPRVEHMSEFKVTLARIEVVEDGEGGKQVCAVFLIERGPIGFHVPIYLRARDFDDSEMVQAARNSLHRMFLQLASESKVWELSPTELERLSNMNLRLTE